ncbi:type ISP restriction/modification enzyme [Cellulomonas hominis]
MSGLAGVFADSALGPGTNRDAWAVGSSRSAVIGNMTRIIGAYETERARITPTLDGLAGKLRTERAKSAATRDEKQVKWSRGLYERLARNTALTVNTDAVRRMTYRPFFAQHLYLDPNLTEVPGRLGPWFADGARNVGFSVLRPNGRADFALLAVGELPSLSFYMDAAQCYPRYTRDPNAAADRDLFSTDESGVDDRYRRIDNITDATLTQYGAWYGPDVTKDHIFAFVYGLLHSLDYRARFAADLKRMPPRIPRIEAADFASFADAGQRLLDLHINYEDAAPYPLTVAADHPTNPGSADLYDWFRVEKPKWAGNARNVDKSSIVYNPYIMVTGIPDAAHRYMLGSRSALEWVLDRYQVKTDSSSGIVNDPNDWSREVGNPRYILDLIAKVTTVSVETMKIVDALPPLRIVEGGQL